MICTKQGDKVLTLKSHPSSKRRCASGSPRVTGKSVLVSGLHPWMDLSAVRWACISPLKPYYHQRFPAVAVANNTNRINRVHTRHVLWKSLCVVTFCDTGVLWDRLGVYYGLCVRWTHHFRSLCFRIHLGTMQEQLMQRLFLYTPFQMTFALPLPLHYSVRQHSFFLFQTFSFWVLEYVRWGNPVRNNQHKVNVPKIT